MTIVRATYSPEDNKLRIYTNGNRVSDDIYSQLINKGFKWAPIQKLFVAPKWSPSRLDLCLKFVEKVEAEETTLLERAEAKAERLDSLAFKRSSESDAYVSAANRLSENMCLGQPILVGHHSERRARNDVSKIDRLREKAVKTADAVSYWLYRAEGVERHANHKNDHGVRARRIKTLLTELRDDQRTLNHAQICINLWSEIDSIEVAELKSKHVVHYVGSRLNTGATTPDGFWGALNRDEMSEQDVIDKSLSWANDIASNEFYHRRIVHTLNRLGYERFMLGETNKFEGKLTATIIKAFARDNGAHKPVCKIVNGNWSLSSSVNLPVHIADGAELELPEDEWKSLMQSCGYEVPEKKAALPPILNFNASSIDCKIFSSIKSLPQVALTKAAYSEIHSDYRGVKTSSCGRFRVKICLDPNHLGPRYMADWVSVFLVDSKKHDAPDSEAIKYAEKVCA